MVAAFPLLMLLESERGLMDSSMCLSPSQVLESLSSFGYILSDHSLSLGGFFWVCVWEGVGFSQGRWELGMWINTRQYPWGLSLPALAIASWVGRSM